MCAARPSGERAALVSWCPCQGTSSSCSSVVRELPRCAQGAPRASMHPRMSRAHLSRFKIWSYGIQITSRKTQIVGWRRMLLDPKTPKGRQSCLGGPHGTRCMRSCRTSCGDPRGRYRNRDRRRHRRPAGTTPSQRPDATWTSFLRSVSGYLGEVDALEFPDGRQPENEPPMVDTDNSGQSICQSLLCGDSLSEILSPKFPRNFMAASNRSAITEDSPVTPA